MKIERTCPRCRAWRYHQCRREGAKAACLVRCAECGHRWRGRLTSDERSDDDVRVCTCSAAVQRAGVHSSSCEMLMTVAAAIASRDGASEAKETER